MCKTSCKFCGIVVSEEDLSMGVICYNLCEVEGCVHSKIPICRFCSHFCTTCKKVYCPDHCCKHYKGKELFFF